MFANITPFKTAERERKATQFKAAADKLYTTLTERFQENSETIKTKLAEAIRTGKTRRDFRVPITFYNFVHWARSYTEAKEELGDEFETERLRLRWEVDENEWDTRVKTDTTEVSVHRIMRSPGFLKRLGAFFGNHFTVSLQVHKVHAATTNYTAVQQTVYLNYWVDPIRLLGPGCTEVPASIEIDRSHPLLVCEDRGPVWYPMK
jgi:uncharacterized protein (DUF1800 family)